MTQEAVRLTVTVTVTIFYSRRVQIQVSKVKGTEDGVVRPGTSFPLSFPGGILRPGFCFPRQ